MLIAYRNASEDNRDRLIQLEQTLKVLKEDLKRQYEEEKMQKKMIEKSEKPKRPIHLRLFEVAINGLKHTYYGFKLFFMEFWISTKYLWRLMKGEQLTRRERQQLIRSTTDTLRLLPFSVFVIVPFMEILLPVYLWFFPGGLPSTFEDASKKAIAGEGGVDMLATSDLQEACRARGMRAYGVSEERLREQLKQWLELSIGDHKIPPSLLLLSRVFYLPEDLNFVDKMKTILAQLPEDLAEQTREVLAKTEGKKVPAQDRLELLRTIEKRIVEERNLAKSVAEKASQQSSAKNIETATSTVTSEDPLEQLMEGDLEKMERKAQFIRERIKADNDGKPNLDYNTFEEVILAQRLMAEHYESVEQKQDHVTNFFHRKEDDSTQNMEDNTKPSEDTKKFLLVHDNCLEEEQEKEPNATSAENSDVLDEQLQEEDLKKEQDAHVRVGQKK